MCTRESLWIYDEVVGVVILGEVKMEFASVKEYLEDKIEVLLVVHHGNEAFWVKALGPRFN